MHLTGINHLAFITNDMVMTIRFYRDLLGMELVAGIGHPGYRHYFFRCGNTQVAFFEYAGASPMERKDHGSPTTLPLGFDHVSFTIGSRADLFALKDKVEAAGFEVSDAVDHGIIWSIYFHDPNGLQLEFTVRADRHEAILSDEEAKTEEVMARWTAETAAVKAERLKPAAAE